MYVDVQRSIAYCDYIASMKLWVIAWEYGCIKVHGIQQVYMICTVIDVNTLLIHECNLECTKDHRNE